MIHYLTREQHATLWESRNYHYIPVDPISINKLRLIEWNVIYYESDDAEDASYWGSVEGNEKHITWFLLNL